MLASEFTSAESWMTSSFLELEERRRILLTEAETIHAAASIFFAGAIVTLRAAAVQ